MRLCSADRRCGASFDGPAIARIACPHRIMCCCRLKDLNSKAPKELKAYAECLDYYR